ncbi:DUF1266 domain-containing protein [Streptomyces sp. NPDC004609]|uniref:DUF1266 domain-containing protein n=1 Tax=Streptomyces sp. NPDC004609 TaxID=3364704 RepID=UPI0036C4F6D4
MLNGEGLAAAGSGQDGEPGHHDGTTASWQAPSPTERELYEAKLRGDWSGYFDVLARNCLYMAEPRALADAVPRRMEFTPYYAPQLGHQYAAVYTEGMLPAPVADPVYFSGSLDWYARVWADSDPEWLAVNPGSPSEAFFPTSPAHRALWRRHAAGGEGRCHPRGQLRALHVGGPLHGPVAHGLACSALLFVTNGESWNSLAYHGHGYTEERRRLQEWWGITTREDWRRIQESLLNAEMVSSVWEFALQIRRSLSLDFGGSVELDHWRQVAERVIRANAEHAKEPRITADGVSPGRPREDSEVMAQVAGVQRLIGRIARYEARFRADGLLGEGQFVRTAEAWDYGRASGMARWGVGGRYCTVQEAESAVLRAGRASRMNYRSWKEFSAAYILGRCLHFDEEEFGDWYEDVLAAHRVLTTDPGSPWLNIPWK